MDDRLEKTLLINAALPKVWEALTDSTQFGIWFRVRLDGPFVLGKVTTGAMTIPGYEGYRFWAQPVAIEPMQRFAFRWPYSELIPADVKNLLGITTLVDFRLSVEGQGTRLNLVESGFASLPAARGLSKLRDNEQGWTEQFASLVAYAGR